MDIKEAREIIRPYEGHKRFPYYFMDEKVRIYGAWMFIEGWEAQEQKIKELEKELAYYTHGHQIKEIYIDEGVLLEKEQKIKALREALESLVYSIAGTHGTKTNLELPEWFRCRMDYAKEALEKLNEEPYGK